MQPNAVWNQCLRYRPDLYVRLHLSPLLLGVSACLNGCKTCWSTLNDDWMGARASQLMYHRKLGSELGTCNWSDAMWSTPAVCAFFHVQPIISRTMGEKFQKKYIDVRKFGGEKKINSENSFPHKFSSSSDAPLSADLRFALKTFRNYRTLKETVLILNVRTQL